MEESLIQNLFVWDNFSWTADENCCFIIQFKFPWVFNPTGYRLKYEFQHFLVSWEMVMIY